MFATHPPTLFKIAMQLPSNASCIIGARNITNEASPSTELANNTTCEPSELGWLLILAK